jgi:hypothetical protein
MRRWLMGWPTARAGCRRRLRHRSCRCGRRPRFARAGIGLQGVNQDGQVAPARPAPSVKKLGPALKRGDGASRPRALARATVSARPCVPSLAYTWRMWVLTVLCETYSSFAISGPDRLVGRYRRTRISLSLSGSSGGCGPPGGDPGFWPASRLRISAIRAAWAVRCRAWRSSRPGAGSSRNKNSAPSGSARSSARSRARPAAAVSPSASRAIASSRKA